jgi:hypothetical protein
LNDNEKNRKFVERIEEFLSEEQDKNRRKINEVDHVILNLKSNLNILPIFQSENKYP